MRRLRMRGPRFRLMARACDQCLMTKDRIVDGERAAQIIAKTRQRGAESYFVCHKASMADVEDVACRPHTDRFPCQLAQICRRLGLVEVIDPETMQPVKEQ